MTKQRITIIENIMQANENMAEQNRQLLDQHQLLGLNIMASPGAGKTSVILQTIAGLADELTIGVIEGDTAGVTIDADKIAAVGMPAVQINTSGQCHLDAPQIAAALPELPLADLDLLIVENVGNLICPGGFALGTHHNVVIASVPEGDDKPYKYPGTYRNIDALILNKMDLLPYINFNLEYFRQGIEQLNPGVAFFPVSCTTGEGFPAWLAWVKAQLAARF
jgi:hydrogenase nickel incorporation protein HypB